MQINRIKASEGATILIALLFFLLCAVAGTVVLSAGVTASGRANGVITEQQSYYAVSSAAQLLKNEINDKTIDCYINSTDSDTTKYYSTPDSSLKKLLENGFETILKGKAGSTYDDVLTIAAGSNDYNQSLGTVEGKFSMDTNFNIEITLYVKNLDNSYKCKVVAPASFLDNKNKEITTLVDSDGNKYTRSETKIIWSGVKIKQLAAND